VFYDTEPGQWPTTRYGELSTEAGVAGFRAQPSKK
jgi:hypothetical protein